MIYQRMYTGLWKEFSLPSRERVHCRPWGRLRVVPQRRRSGWVWGSRCRSARTDGGVWATVQLHHSAQCVHIGERTSVECWEDRTAEPSPHRACRSRAPSGPYTPEYHCIQYTTIQQCNLNSQLQFQFRNADFLNQDSSMYLLKVWNFLNTARRFFWDFRWIFRIYCARRFIILKRIIGEGQWQRKFFC